MDISKRRTVYPFVQHRLELVKNEREILDKNLETGKKSDSIPALLSAFQDEHHIYSLLASEIAVELSQFMPVFFDDGGRHFQVSISFFV